MYESLKYLYISKKMERSNIEMGVVYVSVVCILSNLRLGLQINGFGHNACIIKFDYAWYNIRSAWSLDIRISNCY